MEHIGNIMGRVVGSDQAQGSNDPTDGTRNDTLVTSKEAVERGIPSRTPPPEPVNCEHCGDTLYHDGIILGGQVVFWQQSPRRCVCEKAQRYWAEYDAEQERRNAVEKEQEERNRRRARIERLLGRSGIKKRFLQRTFENFKADTAERKRCYKAAKGYADNFAEFYARGEGLYIEGSNGTGKTHLAAAISLQLINENIPVVCKTSSDLLGDIKRAFDDGERSEYEVLRAYKDVDLLVVDDLGKEQCTDWSMSTLYSIFNDRYEDMKPTIITTNYGEEDLVKALTPKGYDNCKIKAIISRLRETSTVLTMAWEDFRGSR